MALSLFRAKVKRIEKKETHFENHIKSVFNNILKMLFKSYQKDDFFPCSSCPQLNNVDEKRLPVHRRIMAICVCLEDLKKCSHKEAGGQDGL